MKIKYGEKQGSDTKEIRDIPINTAFSGTIDNIDGVYLKTDEGIINLANSRSALIELHLHGSSGGWYIPRSNVYRNRVRSVDNYKELDVELIVRKEMD